MYENCLYFLICKDSSFELKVPQNGIILKNLKTGVFYYYTMFLQPLWQSNKTEL